MNGSSHRKLQESLLLGASLSKSLQFRSDREAKVGNGRKLTMEKLATDKTIPTPLTPPHLPANIEPYMRPTEITAEQSAAQEKYRARQIALREKDVAEES